MKSERRSAARRLLLVGGGHSHVEVLRHLALHPEPEVAVTLISREIAAPYSGMLPGYIAGHYSRDECHIDLPRLCRAANARFLADEVVGIDPAVGWVRCTDRPPVSFDILSLDIGSTPNRSGIPGAAEFALPAKPVDRFIGRWRETESRIAVERNVFRIVVVGGGAGGAELCLALHYRVCNAVGGGDRAPVAFSLVSKTDELLPTHNPLVRATLTRAIRARGIDLHLGRLAERVTNDRVHFAEGEPLAFDALFWATDAAAPAWLGSTGLALNDSGFVRVDESLRSISHRNIFASGDIAALEGMKLEKSGVYAVRQGPVLARNLVAQCLGAPLEAFRPQRHTLALISTGDRYAVASKWRLSIRGRWVWSVKDWIDRRWIRRYRRL